MLITESEKKPLTPAEVQKHFLELTGDQSHENGPVVRMLYAIFRLLLEMSGRVLEEDKKTDELPTNTIPGAPE
jgi:hypothetical protein